MRFRAASEAERSALAIFIVHISQISEERVANVSDKLSEGDMVKVKVLEVDKQGRVRLSIKAVEEAA